MLEKLLVLNSCLRQADRLRRDDREDQVVCKISLWIATVILPDGRMVLDDELIEGQHVGTNYRTLLI